MCGHLQQRGVSFQDTVRRIEGTPTGTANVMLLPDGENSIIIVGGANTADWPLSEAQRAAITTAGVVLLQVRGARGPMSRVSCGAAAFSRCAACYRSDPAPPLHSCSCWHCNSTHSPAGHTRYPTPEAALQRRAASRRS